MNITRRIFLKLSALVSASGAVPLSQAAESESITPFTPEFPNLDSLATGKWWVKVPGGKEPPPPMDVPRDEVIAFGLYTQDHGVLKLSAQLYPLKPDEPREARLEFKRDGEWVEAVKTPVLFPGWSAHFRVGNWDATQDVPYSHRIAIALVVAVLAQYTHPLVVGATAVAAWAYHLRKIASEREMVEHVRDECAKKLSQNNVLDSKNYDIVLDHFGLKIKNGWIVFDDDVKYKFD